jgi:hypothetical protein
VPAVKNHGCPQFLAAETAHFVELTVADRQMLAVHGLAMLTVIDIGIVQIDELVVAIGDDYPVR